MPNLGALVRGVSMSTQDTGDGQLERLLRAGPRVELLPQLADIDTSATLRDVTQAIPRSALSSTLAKIQQGQNSGQ